MFEKFIVQPRRDTRPEAEAASPHFVTGCIRIRYVIRSVTLHPRRERRPRRSVTKLGLDVPILLTML